MKKRLLIIAGPTAVGKTDTAIILANKLNGEIISADSMQIYRHMDIGTAKPTLEERKGVPHHLIDVVNPDENFSVAEFQKMAKYTIDELVLNGKIPIIAGGTGLYINSLVYDMDFTQSVSNWQLREQLQKEANEMGNEFVHNKLKDIDINAANRIHPNNLKKVIRAIEVYYETGDKIGDFSKDINLNDEYEFFLVGLIRDREELYNRINMRVDIMIEQGLIEEVKKLLNLGYSKELVSFKGLGYKEIIRYLEEEYDLDEAVNILKRDTRRYAKRQLTWFRRYSDINWYNISNYSSSEKLAEDIIKDFEGHFSLL
ncbi:tRNA (adenosine(37)-N6)-dimethylallyltransferase MiaA [Alkaliphilus sp. B6464]|uniref:tRNA (adenosine(37)-N6)-dimethylallyltransferase MiaA n=1 Tax=Alkaliphilus sp. B6464 TaxID=2731219 RepID=UPI001BA91C3A|nr:tRNA (adenosine(37)-N6)-dimethylallyltransferase MiaA [Alkaliphilus sp. B6464]QUH20761.1 tRNA (adenosine(37)-N6)-dimethylallyltransferase MiaA [Alkaliphilus sp. B6464]